MKQFLQEIVAALLGYNTMWVNIPEVDVDVEQDL